jgi:hypothetical protein
MYRYKIKDEENGTVYDLNTSDNYEIDERIPLEGLIQTCNEDGEKIANTLPKGVYGRVIEKENLSKEIPHKKPWSGLRTEVYIWWTLTGCPQWDYQTTKKVCLEVDIYFERMGMNPAPHFREAVKNGNDSYMKQWIMGCHFIWLNPQKDKGE